MTRNTKSRFASLVLTILLDLRPCVLHMLLLKAAVLEAMHKSRMRGLEGCCSGTKSPSRVRYRDMEVKKIISYLMKSH